MQFISRTFNNGAMIIYDRHLCIKPSDRVLLASLANVIEFDFGFRIINLELLLHITPGTISDWGLQKSGIALARGVLVIRGSEGD